MQQDRILLQCAKGSEISCLDWILIINLKNTIRNINNTIMKKQILIIGVMLMSSISFSQSLSTEQLKIKEIVEMAYIDGLQNEGDQAKIEAGFHPDFYLLGIDKEDNMWRYAIKDWKAKQVQKREKGELPLNENKKVSAKFNSIDITGNAATVKLEYHVNKEHVYTDYLSLYKFESGWKIVSKIYYKH